MAQQPNLE